MKAWLRHRAGELGASPSTRMSCAAGVTSEQKNSGSPRAAQKFSIGASFAATSALRRRAAHHLNLICHMPDASRKRRRKPSSTAGENRRAEATMSDIYKLKRSERRAGGLVRKCLLTSKCLHRATPARASIRKAIFSRCGKSSYHHAAKSNEGDAAEKAWQLVVSSCIGKCNDMAASKAAGMAGIISSSERRSARGAALAGVRFRRARDERHQ